MGMLILYTVKHFIGIMLMDELALRKIFTAQMSWIISCMK